MRLKVSALSCVLVLLAGCGSNGAGDPSQATQLGTQRAARGCASSPQPEGSGERAAPAAALSVPSGFHIEKIAGIGSPRELAALPNGDLLVGTLGQQIYIVPGAERAGAAGTPQVFATVDDARAAGIAFSASRCEIFVGTTGGIWSIPYKTGDRRAERIDRISSVRTGPVAPHSDGDVHLTTSVAFDDATGTLYAGVGSSCNACTDVDPTRGVILQMHADGSGRTTRATRIRNAIALAVDPATGWLWAGDAGQDSLAFGHPYEFVDAVSTHSGIADYGWPECEENHRAYVAGARCAKTVAPMAEWPAYSTHIGVAFYPAKQRGKYAFPQRYRNALFATSHGSWHTKPGGGYAATPMVSFVRLNAAGRPAIAVDWKDPRAQWRRFVGGFQPSPDRRTGRPTGIAVGARGSLFVADDQTGSVYRIRYGP
jgi:glucose/arabinose dehydrogenase